MMIVPAILLLLAQFFVLWMLIDIIRRPLPYKWAWIIFILVFNPVGAIIYFILIRKNVVNTKAIVNNLSKLSKDQIKKNDQESLSSNKPIHPK